MLAASSLPHAIKPDAVRQLGVRWVVHGLVTRWMDSVRVRLTLYPWQGPKTSLPELRGAADDLPGLTERLSLATLEVVARDQIPNSSNWKLTLDTYFENYHLPSLHKDIEQESGQQLEQLVNW